MNYYLRVFGWLMIGMGLVLGSITALALAGVIPLEITVFGRNLEERAERVLWLIAWLITAGVGIGLLLFGRRGPPKGIILGPHNRELLLPRLRHSSMSALSVNMLQHHYKLARESESSRASSLPQIGPKRLAA